MKLAKKMRGNKNFKAFTLVELILVMGILGVLAAIIVVKFPSSAQRTRDVQRQSDLKSYQNALELFAMKNKGLYPTSGYVPITSLCASLGMSTESCKEDPRGGTYYYETNTSGTSYTVWSSMEKANGNYIVCSGGQSGLANITPASGSCPIGAMLTVTPGPSNTPSPTNAPTPTNTPVPTNTPTPPNTPTLVPPDCIHCGSPSTDWYCCGGRTCGLNYPSCVFPSTDVCVFCFDGSSPWTCCGDGVICGLYYPDCI